MQYEEREKPWRNKKEEGGGIRSEGERDPSGTPETATSSPHSHRSNNKNNDDDLPTTMTVKWSDKKRFAAQKKGERTRSIIKARQDTRKEVEVERRKRKKREKFYGNGNDDKQSEKGFSADI